MNTTYVGRWTFFKGLEAGGGSSLEADDALLESESEVEVDPESEDESSDVVLEQEVEQDESLVSYLLGPCLVTCAVSFASTDLLCLFRGASFATSAFRFVGCVRRRKLRR